MFNSVQLVRDLCRERSVSISKLEKDCGFSNGYLNPKKMSKLPYDRALIIAEYLGVPSDYILTGEMKSTPTVAGKRASDDMQLSAAELDLIRKFRKLDERGKSAVLNVLDHEYAALPGDTSVSRRQA